MMYGLGMPILFPIAAFTLFNQWLCERIVVAWSVKLPPAMDDTLSKNALNLIKWAPLFLLFNGYWMLSNRQIFENSWSYIMTSRDTMASKHIFNRLDINHATPLAVMAFASVGILATQIIFAPFL
jgi:hypothetical protein